MLGVLTLNMLPFFVGKSKVGLSEDHKCPEFKFPGKPPFLNVVPTK